MGEYGRALGDVKSDDNWESERVTRDEWWEFLHTKLFTEPPVKVGFRPS